MRKGRTLRLKGIINVQHLHFVGGKGNPEHMEVCLEPHDVPAGTQTSQLPAQWPRDSLAHIDEVGIDWPQGQQDLGVVTASENGSGFPTDRVRP